jgi:hypothetical protein
MPELPQYVAAPVLAPAQPIFFGLISKKKI